ncbi:MAG: 50S ribosomal protein L25/general stress protein Ctc [Actinomycetota bacterium]|nr:50S ribosomal protein L25/general stress protein Ctc [Actinomycetota bacterium]
MERKLVGRPRQDRGKGAARRLRANGLVPAVVYGHGADPVHLAVDARELLHLLHTDAGTNVLVNLRVDSEQLLAIPREIQRDHIKGQFIHIDFLRVARDEKIAVEVPVHLVGESHGVKEGGVVEHHLWNVQVECLPQDVPTGIEADISNLGINESLKVADVPAGDKFTILTSPEEVIVSVVPPQVLKVEEEEVAEAVEGEAVEPETAEASPVEEPQPEG